MAKNENNCAGTKKEHLNWTSQMDDAFTDAMLHQMHEGNRPDGTFTPVAYTNMVQELHNKFPQYDFTKAHLKNCLKTLKIYFSKSYDLFRIGTSGFSWSPVTKLWSAEPEVWKTLIEAKPEAAKWMSKPVNNYDKLEELFAKDRATGEGAETAKEKRRRWANSVGENNIESIDDGVANDEITLENFINFDDDDGLGIASPKSSSQTRGQSDATNSKGKKRKVSNDDKDEVKVLETALNNVADAIREGNTVLERSRARVYSEDEIFNELLALGMDSSSIDEAYLFLIQNPDKVRALFGCPPGRRINILEKMMNNYRGH